METGLRGRSALITGGAAGIGKAIALALSAEGARVIVADLNADQGRAAVDEIVTAGGSARFIACDVVDETAVAAAVASVVAEEGQLYVMVNNAGIGPQQAPLVESTAEDWDRVFAINLRGVFFGIKHAARAMLAQQIRGSIINISSVAGLGAATTLGPYGATKAGVLQLTQTAAVELAAAGIRVNAICPGWTETAILGTTERSRLIRQIPMQRIGRVDEIASMIVYLASDAASFVTGSTFRVDGGMRS